MVAKAKEHSIKASDIQSRAAADSFLEKVASTPKPARDAWKCSNLQTSCFAFLAKLAKTFKPLVVFHVLNIAVTILGVVFAVMLLANVSLAPDWFLLFTFGVLVRRAVVCINSFIHRTWLRCLVYFLLVLSWLASGLLKGSLILLITCGVLVVGEAQALLYSISFGISYFLVKRDVRLARFVDTVIGSITPTGADALSPEECAYRFEFPGPFEEDKFKFFSPHVVLTRRIWGLLFYYAVLKVLVGVMSAMLIVLVLIQPVAALCTLGHDPFIGYWIHPREYCAVYIFAVISLWVLGVIGLQRVARLSVKTTVLVCGPWKSEEPARQGEIDPEVLATPAQEPATTSFTPI